MSRDENTKIRGDDVRALGIADGPIMGVALRCLPKAIKVLGREAALAQLRRTAVHPLQHTDDPWFADVATRLIEEERKTNIPPFIEREHPAPFANFCPDAEEGAFAQMNNSLRLPSAIRGALMPDAHQGYGLPIGGVLETEGTIIPFAVGVDIACRMKMTVLDIDPDMFEDDFGTRRGSGPAALERALMQQTCFGMGGKLANRADDPVMDDERWGLTQQSKHLRDKAWEQLGTSGSGNHFCSFDVLTLEKPGLGLAAGRYVALLSHSGSRGSGAQIADFYSKLASKLHPELPKELSHLAWLDLDHESGQEYLALMQLMDRYASGNHAVIHDRVASHLKANIIAGVENTHNLAWLEERDGRQVVVHRKGATPAGLGVLGVIPGSMGTPAFVVSGKGEYTSIESASHGAGRAMSRTAARQQFNWKMIQPMLDAAHVKLLSAGIDENPLAYKKIETVMANQTSLIDVVARLDPRIVRMADAGERPED
jgi:tRNA-splicing ligase RtcB